MARRGRPPRAGAVNELSPLKILGQIVILQTIYYVTGAMLILFTSLVFGKNFNLGLVLDWRSLRGDTTVGWTLGLCWMLDALVG
jgi:protein SYS1